ncbi:von Willebrand factor A domain-containing protein 7 [Anolis carolinensis]|uniref:von Willebrand factor A domain-containing protein 7 n=1 Tax=Anolis carolinensis TaxID=28377 RepID=UPI0007DB6CED|nr:PREDICTED: von Willebrand factor A domain-containing protein 7 [Anolis carolinensis]|eukprot:XP_008103953.2 PREDICTED: von Willebrand factor A domain-containing protein 7 [Anolis carolinensis]
MLLPRNFPLLLCLSIASGFLPNHESGGIESDFTDADITEMGVLRAVASYMERNPLPGKPATTPGKLENMKPLTATGLFKAYFQADVSPSRFMKALQEIINGNNLVETRHREDSSFFFYCEDIPKSITQLRIQRDSMMSSLKGAVTLSALESARESAGKALHILQKFYSNTNWVEMGNSEPYEYLLNRASPAFPVTPKATKTCVDCIKEPGGGYSCDKNLIVKDMLTSGYLGSTSCRRKLPGKCGHGGIKDAAQNFPPTGGINKETSDSKLSPHYKLHKQAAELAIQATRNFFVGEEYGLLNQVGIDTFKKFFNLEGYSLTFVIDTTGSMSDDIQQVKIECIKKLREYSKTPDAPFNYVLVPFNDPDVGPVMKTDKVDMFESYISNLKVSGGGDCPEMSLGGLKLALQESLPRSKIFSFTDAGAKDAGLKDEIKVLGDSTGSTVSYLLTGYCSSRKRRNIAARTYANIYEELAAYFGGYYARTTKKQLSQILGVMELSLNAAPVKVARSLITGTQFSFPVDETITEITVSVKSSSSSAFSIAVLKPSGATSPSSVIINTADHKIVKVSPVSDRGSWTVRVSPSGSYEVEIGGKSLMDFSYQIMQKQKEYVLPVQGRPVKGANYTFSMRVMGDAKGAVVRRLAYISGEGSPIGSVALTQTSDAFGNILAVAPIILNAPSTLLIIEGLSPGGLPFSRVSAEPINTESVQILPLPGQNGTLSPGETLELSVVVVNDGPEASFSFKVSDDLGLLKSFKPTSISLGKGKNVTITAIFMASGKVSGFASSIATFTAKSSTAQNYLKLPITVIPETALETDETAPVYKLLDFYMPCTGKLQQKPVCSGHSWRMRFSATDAESAVTVRVNPNPAGLSCSPQGTSGDKDVICHYQSDCCSPYVEVKMSDENGNTETLKIDYRRSRSSAA